MMFTDYLHANVAKKIDTAEHAATKIDDNLHLPAFTSSPLRLPRSVVK